MHTKYGHTWREALVPTCLDRSEFTTTPSGSRLQTPGTPGAAEAPPAPPSAAADAATHEPDVLLVSQKTPLEATPPGPLKTNAAPDVLFVSQ